MIALFGWLPGAPITLDQWGMLERDSVAAAGPGFERFAIRPAPLAAVTEDWLILYRRQGRFSRMPAA